jgi:hypothetical protein
MIIQINFEYKDIKNPNSKKIDKLLECYRLDRKQLETIMGADDSWVDDVFMTPLFHEEKK